MPILTDEIASVLKTEPEGEEPSALISSCARHERRALCAYSDSMPSVASREDCRLECRGLPAEDCAGLIDDDEGTARPTHYRCERFAVGHRG